ncbi:unnamed protein product [Parajaminaea phylloscopi]
MEHHINQADADSKKDFELDAQRGVNVNEKALGHLPYGEEAQSVDSVDAAFAQLAREEESHDIKLRTMGWKKTAALLFGEQVCLAIMAQAWSFSVLGWGPALVTTFLAGIFFWVTSYTMWRYMMKHPGLTDICDIAYLLFGKSRIAYEVTAFMLLANNILLIGFHILTAAKIFNTLSDHSLCTVSFNVIGTAAGIVLSLPRTLNHVSYMSMFSAFCMAIAILLFLIFSGTEDHPALGYQGDYPIAGPVRTYALPVKGTTWIDCMNAALNITFLWVPQVLFPQFLGEMRRPQDFPKALAALAVASFVLFIVPAAIGFAFLGQYATAPAFGSLETVYKKASFGPVIVPTLIIGAIYSNVTAKHIYRRVMRGSSHQHRNTLKGWAPWVGITAVVWAVGFIFASVIPSMGDFLSLLGAAFDSYFGFGMWAIAYYRLYRGEFFNGPLRSVNTVFHAVTMLVGLFLLGPGLYAACKAIAADYAGSTRPAFTCKNLAI